MKRIITAFTAAAAVIMISGCSFMSGSGNIVSTEFMLDGFTSVESGSTCDLSITEGDEFSVKIMSDDNLLDDLDVRMLDQTLMIYLKPFSSYNNITFEAEVVMPALEELKISGASRFSITGFDTVGTFSIDVSGASDGEVNLDSAENIRTVTSGASDLKMSAGEVSGTLDVSCSGASDIDLRSLPAGRADVDISGASSVWLNISDAVIGSVSGASSLYYGGGTNISSVNVDISSGVEPY